MKRKDAFYYFKSFEICWNFLLWPSIWSVFINVLNMFENNRYSAVGEYSVLVRSSLLTCSVPLYLYWFFVYLILLLIERNVLKFTAFTDLSISVFCPSLLYVFWSCEMIQIYKYCIFMANWTFYCYEILLLKTS